MEKGSAYLDALHPRKDIVPQTSKFLRKDKTVLRRGSNRSYAGDVGSGLRGSKQGRTLEGVRRRTGGWNGVSENFLCRKPDLRERPKRATPAPCDESPV